MTKYPGVQLGENVTVEDYVIIGKPSAGKKPGDRETVIGDRTLIRSHTVIYMGNVVGTNCQTGHHVLIREDNIIGDSVSIGSHSIVEHHVTIEDDVRIHSQAFIPEFSILKKGCWIGPNAVLTNARYPQSPRAKENLEGPTISEGAKIGANATILPGVRIGENALVGAGAVVTKDVAPGTVVAGNPAVVINEISELNT
jgi:acetyltransferase-like isoleucine patch superfamily enzyme